MPEPTIKNGEEYFFPIIYEGNGAGQRVGKFVPFDDSSGGTIANSVIFNDADSAYLSRTPSGTGNRKTFTFSGWVKRGVFNTSNGNDLFNAGTNPANNVDQLLFDSSNRIRFYSYGGSYLFQYITNRTFEDTSKWYHIVCAVDTTQSSASDRVKIYVDGDLITSFSTETNPALNGECFHFNNTSTHYIGANVGSQRFYDGYIAEYNFVDGQQLTPDSFALTDTSTGRWVPATVRPYPTTTTTYTVTVVGGNPSNHPYYNVGSTNKFAINGSTATADVTLNLIEGATYRFDQSDNSNSGHPLRFSTTANGIHGGGSEYTVGVVTNGVPGNSGAYTEITVASGSPTLYFYCSNHSAMGWTANTQAPYGTNGFRLQFGTNSALGTDTSGNSNTFTATNLATTDQTTDSPTQNHATWNPNPNTGGTLSEGNLKLVTANSGYSVKLATLKPKSGKYYSEFTIGTESGGLLIGVQELATAPSSSSTTFPQGSGSFAWRGSNGFVFNGGSSSVAGSTYTTGDVLAIALDLDNQVLKFYKNNSLDNTIGLTGKDVAIAVGDFGNTQYGTVTANFGQKSFTYTPPTGFVALQQDNLPETAKGITGMVWIKNRDEARSNVIYDSSRGAGQKIQPDKTNADTLNVDGVTKFLKGGVAVGSQNQSNDAGDGHVAWNWVANGGVTSTNNDGSISSVVQANTVAGFSIVQYTGSGSNATVGHGLSSAPPEWILVKSLDDVIQWTVQHKVLTATSYLHLNLTNASASTTVVWNDTNPTSTVFSVGTANAVNKSGSKFIAYCWHSVDGYSKFGSYSGNGNSNGVFVHLGFEPAWVMIKCFSTSGNGWTIHDNKRMPFNGSSTETTLYANSSQAEQTSGGNLIDFLSNGFKVRGTNTNINGSRTYIYMAFAEHPFVGDGTSPVTAR